MEVIISNTMSLVVGFGIAILFVAIVNLYMLIDFTKAIKELRDKHRNENDNDQSDNKTETENNSETIHQCGFEKEI